MAFLAGWIQNSEGMYWTVTPHLEISISKTFNIAMHVHVRTEFLKPYSLLRMDSENFIIYLFFWIFYVWIQYFIVRY